MDSTIRNIDGDAYRALRARAVLEGKTMGEMVSEAMVAYLARPSTGAGGRSLLELKPTRFPPGNERLSESIDDVVYD